MKAKGQQYEQYLISKKFKELKSTTPKGTNTREEKIYRNNTEWMPKAEKKSENTINRNQESGIIQKQIKSINLDAIKSDSKGKKPVAKLRIVLVVPSTTKIFQVKFFLPCQFYK